MERAARTQPTETGRGWFSVCTSDDPGFGSAGFGSVAEALHAGEALADYLNSPAADDLDAAARGEALVALGRIQSRLTAAHTAILRRFDAGRDHDTDGYPTTAAWLTGKTRQSRQDARAAVRQMRLLGRHPQLEDAAGTGQLSGSWAREIAGWTSRLPAGDMREQADQILLDAAAAGADLNDLRIIAQAAYEAWRARHPDPDDDPGKGFDERFLQLDTTMDNAGRITGDLTPECAAAVQAVLEALGKKQGPEDDRTAAQRHHDALQEACELLIRAKMVPGRAGADTRVDVHIGLADLRGMNGASLLEETWLAAQAGQHGYLTGKDAQTIACDALIVPVVTGSPDWDAIRQIIYLVLHAHGVPAPGLAPQPLPPEAWEALQYALARLAIGFVSGPGALASVLRTGLLPAPYNGKSVPLDIGYSEHIPEAIRRAVILRDQHCAWPGGCDRRPAVSDVHHITHKKDGGKTSVDSCVLLCQYHHDICIHRWGWEIELLPDGSTRAYGPQGQVLRSHSPPDSQAA